MNIESTETKIVKLLKQNNHFRDIDILISNQNFSVNEKKPIIIVVKLDYSKPKASNILTRNDKSVYYARHDESIRLSVLSYGRDISTYPILIQSYFREMVDYVIDNSIVFSWGSERIQNLSDLEGSDRITRFDITYNIERIYELNAEDTLKINDFVLDLNVLGGKQKYGK